MVVEMQDGTVQILLWTPFDGKVIHQGSRDDVFGPATETPETEFRKAVRRIVSRSPYDKR